MTTQPSEEGRAARYGQDSDKPGSVIPLRGGEAPPFIQASHYWLALSTYPCCWKDGRDDRFLRRNEGGNTAWYFNPRGLPTRHVTIAGRALLPHVFTLTYLPKKAGGLAFCGTFRTSRIREAPAVSRRGTLRCPDFPLVVLPKGPPAVEWTWPQGENVWSQR